MGIIIYGSRRKRVVAGKHSRLLSVNVVHLFNSLNDSVHHSDGIGKFTVQGFCYSKPERDWITPVNERDHSKFYESTAAWLFLSLFRSRRSVPLCAAGILSVCWSFCLSVSCCPFSVRLPASCLPDCLSDCLSDYRSVCLSVRLSVSLSD